MGLQQQVSTDEPWLNPHGTEAPNVTDFILPFGYRILIMPVAAPEKLTSGLYLPDQAKDNHDWLNYVGQLVAKGPGAYKHRKYESLQMTEENMPQIGDWVLYSPYQPYRIVYRDTKLVCLNDETIIAVIPKGVNPWDFKVLI
jgi:co-chaperonin GroES (HSP10)